jgi:hypothetical protein
MMAFWQTVSDRSSAQVGQTLQGIAKIIGSIVLGQIQAQACFLHDSSVESDFALQEFILLILHGLDFKCQLTWI